MIKIQFPLRKDFYSYDYIEFHHNDTLLFKSNHIYYIHGRNGTGKTTFINILSLLTSFQGHYSLENTKIVFLKTNNDNLVKR